MDKRPVREIVVANVRKIIEQRHSSEPEKRRVKAAAAHLKMTTYELNRFLKAAHDPQLDTVARIALRYNYEPYQLLMPELNLVATIAKSNPETEEIDAAWELLFDHQRESILTAVREARALAEKITKELRNKQAERSDAEREFHEVIDLMGQVGRTMRDDAGSDDARNSTAPADVDSDRKGAAGSKKHATKRSILVGSGRSSPKTTKGRGAKAV